MTNETIYSGHFNDSMSDCQLIHLTFGNGGSRDAGSVKLPKFYAFDCYVIACNFKQTHINSD